MQGGPVGWTSRPMQGGVPRHPAPGKLRRSSREERHEPTAAREERSAWRCRHRSPAGCRGASRGTATHFPATHLLVGRLVRCRVAQWVGRLVRCRVASRAALLRASYDDLPEKRDTNATPRERNDSRRVDAIAPRQDAGEPRARRATHFPGTHMWVGRPVRCRVAQWVGRLVRCSVASRAALLQASYDALPEKRDTNRPRRERNDSRRVDAIAPRQDAGEPRARRATHFPATHLWVGRPVRCRVAQWVGRLVRCRVASRATLPRASYDDPPEKRDTNGLHRERSDPRGVVAIAPRQDAGEPRARRATHFPATHLWVGRPVRCRVAQWVGRPVRCRVASRATLLQASYDALPEKRDTNRPRRERSDPRGVVAIAPRQDAGEPRARRATHFPATHMWVGRLVRCRVASRATLLQASYDDPPEKRDTNGLHRERSDPRGVVAIAPRQDAGEPRARRATHYAAWRPAPPCSAQVTTILPRRETRTDCIARGAIRVALRPSLPGRMSGSLARDARPTFPRPTCGLDFPSDAGWPSGLDVSSDAGWRPAPPCPGQVATILPRRETRTDCIARGAIRVALSPSLPGRMPGSLARDARPTFPRPTCGLDVSSDAGWPSGLDVSSDAGWRPAPPCSRQVTTILPRRETRTDCIARGAIRVALSPSLPGRMPGSLARDARPTLMRDPPRCATDLRGSRVAATCRDISASRARIPLRDLSARARETSRDHSWPEHSLPTPPR